MYLRVFASCDETPVGLAALEYVRSLVRIAKIQIIDPGQAMFGGPSSRVWESFAPLMMGSPIEGEFVNVVMTHPSRWAWRSTIKAPKADGEHEVIESVSELWTRGVRNVLFASAPPRNKLEYGAVMKFDHVIVSTINASCDVGQWPPKRQTLPVTHIGLPVRDHAAVRRIVIGD